MYFSVFEWLTESLEKMFFEFEQFIEKEDSSMCERYLPWSRITSSSYHARLARGVMNNAKRSIEDEGRIFSEESCDGIYLRYFDDLIDRHRRKDRAKCLREHRLATSWRSLEYHIVSPRRCDKERSFRMVLSEDR